MVRKKLPHAQIGFFLHASFPSSEVFRCLAVRHELLEGVLGSNLIGFQTEEYCRHFLQTCSRLLCVEATNEGVQLEDRYVNVIDLAIGIDPKALSIARRDPGVTEWTKAVRDRYEGKTLIVARDKLDHVRGVRQKLLAYELFLDRYPEWREKVSRRRLTSNLEAPPLPKPHLTGPHAPSAPPFSGRRRVEPLRRLTAGPILVSGSFSPRKDGPDPGRHRPHAGL